jgi:hypothetical protein
MPASGNPEGQEEARTDAAEALDTAEELAQLETAIDSLVQDVGSMRDRGLRAIVTEAGKRAERIRSRLMLMEDELADD